MKSNLFAVLLFIVAGLFAGAACDALPGVGNIPGNLAFDIVDAGGFPQAYVTVQAAKVGAVEPTQVVTADENGHVFFGKLDPGEYTIYILGPTEEEYPTDPAKTTFKLAPGRTLNETITITRGVQMRKPTLKQKR